MCLKALVVKEFQSEVMVADCMEQRRRSCWGEKSGVECMEEVGIWLQLQKSY